MSESAPVQPSAHPITDRPAAEAIPALFEDHGDRVYGLARRLCRTPEEAEDLLQETFLTAFRRWETFDGRAEPTTWLYTIASRLCRRFHRRKSGEPARLESLEELLPAPADRLPAESSITASLTASDPDDPVARQIRRESRQRLTDALANLPADFRLPLLLKDVVGLPLKDVGRIVDLPPATVKTRVHRARLKLRQAVAASVPDAARTVAPSPTGPTQLCLDMLDAKQEALDLGLELTIPSHEICSRCRSVFATLDLSRDVCRELADGRVPVELRSRLLHRLETAGTSADSVSPKG